MRILNPYLSPLQKPQGFIVNGNPSASTDIANYPFTADLLDTVNGYELVSSVAPTPSATGIPLVTATNGKIPSTGWPVNDYVITFTMLFNETPSGAPVIMENEYSVSGDTNLLYMKSNNLFEWLRFPSNSAATLTTVGDANGRTFDVTMTQSSTDGMTLNVVEIGGSSFSGTATNTTANAKTDVPAWTGFMELAQRGAGFELDYSLKDFVIAPL